MLGQWLSSLRIHKTVISSIGAVFWILSECSRISLLVRATEVDVCMSKTFRAECWENEVVVMETALYGRMEVGDCVKTNLGYIGCKEDVLKLADRWCSGRNACDVIVPTPDLDQLNPCLEDLRTYLHASYKCVKVAYGTKEYCSSHRQIPLSSNKAYLSSQVATRTGCGTRRAPWVIEASPGQTISLGLQDFGVWRLQGEMEREHRSRDMYGYIYEPGTGTNVTITSIGARTQELFTSTTNVVQIVLLAPTTLNPREFLVQYETRGCADLNPPKYAWYRRDQNTAVIGCKASRHTKQWHLTCVENTWQGVVGNCSAPVMSDSSQQLEGFPFSTEVSITVIILIAFVFAGIVLVIGVLYLRNMRRSKHQHTQQQQLQQQKKKDAMSSSKLQHHHSSHHRHHPSSPHIGTMHGGDRSRPEDAMLPKKTRPNSGSQENTNSNNPAHNVETGRIVQSHSVSDITSVGTGNAYIHIWERPLPDPHGNQMLSDSDYASQSNYSGATRQSKATGDNSDSLYNVEGCGGSRDGLENATNNNAGLRYFMNNDKE